jgi:hypothetical protein
MIEANGLTKRLGGRVVVDVSFRCEPGTVTGPAIRTWCEQTTAAAK